jgi:hypothetical protein
MVHDDPVDYFRIFIQGDAAVGMYESEVVILTLAGGTRRFSS